jgi:ABC-type antimicrobial peptide transport system permease subunit
MFTLARFTLQDLYHDRNRSLLTIISLAVVVLSYLLLSSLSQAYLIFGKQSQTSQNLMIIAKDALDPMESSLKLDILQSARSIAPHQIRAVFPSIFRHMRIEEQIMQVNAVPQAYLNHTLNLTLLQGQWPAGLDEVAISEGVSQITPWKIGESIKIYGADFKISGLLRAGGNKFASLWMTYPAGQALFGSQRGFQIGYIALDTSADPEAVRALLQADSRIAADAAVYLEGAVSDRYNQVNQDMLTLSLVQAVISLLAITFGTFNAASLTLTERSVEIDLLRLIGFTKGKIATFLLTRTFVETLAAFVLGWLGAAVIIKLFQTHTPIDIQAAPLSLTLDLPASLLGLGLSICFAALGVWLNSARRTRQLQSSFR